MYFAVENMQASDYCHSTIGPVLNTTFAVRTEGLSTAHFVSVSNPGYALAHFTGIPQVAAWYPFDIADYTSCNPNNNVYNYSDPKASAGPGEGPGWFPSGVAKTRVTMLTNILNPNGIRITEIWNPCRPWIGFPTEVLGLAPEWSSCTTSIWPLYDPPYALAAQSQLAPPVTSAGPTTVVPAQPITTPADPGNKPTMFAPSTVTAMEPGATAKPSSGPQNSPVDPGAKPSTSVDSGVAQNTQNLSQIPSSGGIAGIIVSMLDPNPAVSLTTAPAPAAIPIAMTITLPVPPPNPSPNAPAATIIAGGQTLQVPSPSFVIAAGSTLQPGGPAATVSNVVFSVDTAGSLVVAIDSSSALAPTPPTDSALRGFSTIIATPVSAMTLALPTMAGGAPGSLVVGGQTLPVPSTGAVVVASSTLLAGGPAATVSGSIYSVNSAGSLIVAPTPLPPTGSGSGTPATARVTSVHVTATQLLTLGTATLSSGASGLGTVRGATPTISAFKGAASRGRWEWEGMLIGILAVIWSAL